jgi:hypothetical protein
MGHRFVDGRTIQRRMNEKDARVQAATQRRHGNSRGTHRCALHQAHQGPHLWVKTTDPTPLFGECRARQEESQ